MRFKSHLEQICFFFSLSSSVQIHCFLCIQLYLDYLQKSGSLSLFSCLVIPTTKSCMNSYFFHCYRFYGNYSSGNLNHSYYFFKKYFRLFSLLIFQALHLKPEDAHLICHNFKNNNWTDKCTISLKLFQSTDKWMTTGIAKMSVQFPVAAVLWSRKCPGL